MGNHEQMPHNLKTLAERLEYVLKCCEYPSWAELADALNVTPQAVKNWRDRNAIGPANRKKLREITGVSIEWLESDTGDPFPTGVKAYIGPVSLGAAAAIKANKDAVDQLRGVALALIDLITGMKQGAAGELAESLDQLVHGEAARQSFHANLLKTLRDRAHTESLHPPRHARGESNPHKRAS